MKTGKIKFYNIVKAFGFITEDVTGVEYFFHLTGLIDLQVDRNDRVRFEIIEKQGKTQAVNVQKI